MTKHDKIAKKNYAIYDATMKIDAIKEGEIIDALELLKQVEKIEKLAGDLRQGVIESAA